MYLFTVEIEQRRTRTVTVPAPNAEAAKVGARVLLRPNDRVVGVTRQVTQAEDARDARAIAQEILSKLLAQQVPGPAGGCHSVKHWAGLVQHSERRIATAADSALARCGLRAEPGQLIVASPTQIPALAIWFNGTPFVSPLLHATLRRLPGAADTVRTFAGIRSRAVMVPVPELAVAA